MNGTDNNHLSPDRLEDAVRGRLSAAEMAAVRSHCATCDVCQKAWDEELRIAQGTREWARGAMKQRLAGHIARASQRRIPWPRVMAAAALVLVIAGAGILYRWMETGRETVQTYSDNVQPLLESPAPEQRKPPASAAEKQDISGSVSADNRSEVQREGNVSAENRSEVLREGNVSADSQSKVLREKKESVAPSRSDRLSTTGSGSTQNQPFAAPPAAAPLADAEVSTGTGGSREALIVWGTIAQEVPAVGKAVEEDTRAVMKDKGVSETARARGKATRMAAVQQHTFVIGQIVRGGLGLVLTPGHSGTMPAKLFRSGDTVYVTLLLDSLLTTEEIRSAYVRECTADSFQVVLPGGTTIGIRSPSGLAR
jgi:hypothetical protein